MPTATSQPDPVHYLPIATTLLAAAFLVVLVRRHHERGGTHLLWWSIGVFTYGLGTALESAITLCGNSAWLNKAWYAAGAVLGGYPLAQGTIFLLLQRRTARALTWVSLPLVAVTAALVLLSPVRVEELQPHRPGGAALEWSWLRLMTPLINSYAAIFLIGGAALSAWRYARRDASRARAVGNALIATGALLPGIGGGMAKAGVVEGLYVGELVGLVLIWLGYAACVRAPITVAQGMPQLT